jgi:hypothetical protein
MINEAVLVVRGYVPPKKNQYRSGKGGFYLPQDVKERLDLIEAQIRKQWGRRPAVRHPNMCFELTLRSTRSDRDNTVQTLLDCMQRAGVIENDNVGHCNGWILIAPAEVARPSTREPVCVIRLTWGEDAETATAESVDAG